MPRERSGLFIIALLGLCVIGYANSLQGGFVFDDRQLVPQNSAVLNIHSLRDALAVGSGWRQLLSLTYGLNFYFGGLNTFGYHLLNVALHTTNVLLVFGIVRGVTDQFSAFAGAAVFAVHTFFSSAVSYIAGRSSVLCATFYFAAVLLFLRGIDEKRPRVRLTFFALSGVAGLLAFQAKQEAITLPLFLAAAWWLRQKNPNWRVVAGLIAIPFLAALSMWRELTALYATVTGNQNLVSGGLENVLQPMEYFRTYLAGVATYVLPRFVFPGALSADPQIKTQADWYSPGFLVAVVMLSGLVWLVLRMRQREPLLALGIAAILVSPLAAYAVFPIADVIFEHRAYIPGLGVALVGAWIFQRLAQRNKNLSRAAAWVAVIVLLAMTVRRNPVFASNVTLWEDAEKKSPEKPRPHLNLGQAYQNSGRKDDALREYEHALTLNPDLHVASTNIAAIYLDRGELGKAEEVSLRVASRAPNFTEAFINLGVVYLRKQEPDKAIAAFDRVLAANPNAAAANFNKAEALTMKRDFEQALKHYQSALNAQPDQPAFQQGLAAAKRNLHHDRGVSYLKQRLLDQAITEFRTTLDLAPAYGPGVLNLATAYELKGDRRSARALLESFLATYGNSDSPYVAPARQKLRSLAQ
jgi:tetratricopeptide (TPR) repeat protein